MTSTSRPGRLVSINVNPRGGVPKLPVAGANISLTRVEGDKQRNRRIHGGPLRAVCLFSLERIEALQAEGHPIAPGTTGENLTIAGLDWNTLGPGMRLRIGDVELETTSYTVPCKNIAASFRDEQFNRISQKLHPGWSRLYARVVSEGCVQTGDLVQILVPE